MLNILRYILRTWLRFPMFLPSLPPESHLGKFTCVNSLSSFPLPTWSIMLWLSKLVFYFPGNVCIETLQLCLVNFPYTWLQIRSVAQSCPTLCWSPSEWTDWISLQSKGLSRVFSNTTVQKHQFFGAQPSSQSNSHIHTWPLEKP